MRCPPYSHDYNVAAFLIRKVGGLCQCAMHMPNKEIKVKIWEELVEILGGTSGRELNAVYF